MKKQYVIIGASAAGIAAASKLRQLDGQARIICITQETERPYNKCFLADYLSGIKEERAIFLKQEDFFKTQNIELLLGQQVTSLNKKEQTIECNNGQTFSYTALLLATGSSLSLPPIEGIKGVSNVFQFHTLRDTKHLLAHVAGKKINNVVVVGAGLSGLECADSLSDFVKTITVVERAPQLLPHQITSEASKFIEQAMRNEGVTSLCNSTVTRVEQKNGTVVAVYLADGKKLLVDMLVCATGMHPNSELAKEAGLTVEQHAVVTNEYLATSDPHIFAAGDVALVTDLLSGKKMRSCSWPDALKQGAIAASNMSEIVTKYSGTIATATTAFFGLKLSVAGNIHNNKSSYNSELRKNSESFSLTFFKKGVVKGFLLIGPTVRVAQLKRSLLAGNPYCA